MNRKALTAAFPATVPVLMGYLAIGMAFGLMLETAGYGVGWALLMSMTIYAGSGQYLGVSLLATGASLSSSTSGTWYTVCPCWRSSVEWAPGSFI